VNCVNPGICKTKVQRQFKFPTLFVINLATFLVGRSSEEGSRELIWAVICAPSGARDEEDEEDIHLLKGVYIANARVEECSDYALSEEGKVMREMSLTLASVHFIW
jgi:retinol dehydrogenase 12